LVYSIFLNLSLVILAGMLKRSVFVTFLGRIWEGLGKIYIGPLKIDDHET